MTANFIKKILLIFLILLLFIYILPCSSPAFSRFPFGIASEDYFLVLPAENAEQSMTAIWQNLLDGESFRYVKFCKENPLYSGDFASFSNYYINNHYLQINCPGICFKYPLGQYTSDG